MVRCGACRVIMTMVKIYARMLAVCKNMATKIASCQSLLYYENYNKQSQWERRMQTAIESVIEQFGYLGICLLILLENVFPPIPSEIVLTFGGFVTHHTSLDVPGVIVAATIGSVLGAIVLYWVGRILSAERIERLVAGRTGKVLRLTVADVRKVERWFTRHGNSAVFWGRFVPIVRSLISIPAGTTGMPFVRFVVLSAVGTSIWNVVLVMLGRAAGSAWQQVAAYVDTYALIVLVVGVVAVVIFVVWYFKKRVVKGVDHGE